jgi:hypothetical protein
MALPRLPRGVSQGLRVLGPCFHHRHPLVCRWRLVRPLVDGDRANLQERRRHGPAPLASQPSRRLLWAGSWGTTARRWGCAAQALQAFPPPEDGLLSLVGDRTRKGTRGPRPPVAQKPRLRPHQPDVFGLRIVSLLAPWETSRLPVEFALVRRPDDPADQTEQACCRPMRHAFRRPAWG